jgi:hypothetical protein
MYTLQYIIAGIPIELLKYGGNSVINFLTYMFNQILMGEVMPQKWNSTYICPTYKKGDIKDRNNHTDISITNSIGRIPSSVRKNKIANMIKESETAGSLLDNKLGQKKS